MSGNKKFRKTKVLIIIVFCLVVAYVMYEAFVRYKWGQYLPSTDIVVDSHSRKYHLLVPTDPPDAVPR